MIETMELVGTGGAELKASRNGTYVFVEVEGSSFLFDCAKEDQARHLAQFIDTLVRFKHEVFFVKPAGGEK